MNQYPVLFISFKDAEGENFEDAYKMLEYCLADVCKESIPIINNASVDNDDKQLFLRLKAKTAAIDEVKYSLKTLTRILSAIYGKKVILLIDEYDVPLAHAAEKDSAQNNYYTKMLDVMRAIMSTALKDNEYLQCAVITGCLKITKESIFTGTNNFVSYSVLDEDFSSYFGFTEDEVDTMLGVDVHGSVIL